MHNFTKIRDFHGTRLKGVGSSDIPVLAGLTKQWGTTPYTLWLEKTGRAAPWSGNQATWWGTQLEGLVLKEWVSGQYDPDIAQTFYRNYLHRRSTDTLKVYTTARHPDPDYHFALAHADLVVEEDGGLLVEAKSHGLHAAKRGDDPDFGYLIPEGNPKEEIPASVFLQVQWQMLVYGARQVCVSALINTNDYREYSPILPDKETQEKSLAAAEKFWWHVENDQEPMPITWLDVCAIFPNQKQTTAMVGGEDEMMARLMVEKWHKAGEGIKRLKARRENIKNALGCWIGENSVLTTAEGVKLASSWEQNNPPGFDLKRFKAEHPRIYAKAVAEGIITFTKRRELRPARLRG